MDKKMSDFSFLQKVEWEGGVFGALSYGLEPDDLPEDSRLKPSFTKIYEAWEKLSPLLEEFEAVSQKIECGL